MSAERFVTEGDGYTTWHCFSSGAHYDPARISWGPVIAIDEHLVSPGGGFEWHPHRGVHIASWVLSGTLRHQDSDDHETQVGPGTLLVQSTGEGLRHRETNASMAIPLRMVQIVVLGSAPTSLRRVRLPGVVGGVTVELVDGPVRTDAAAYDLASGEFATDGSYVRGAALLFRPTAMSENRR